MFVRACVRACVRVCVNMCISVSASGCGCGSCCCLIVTFEATEFFMFLLSKITTGTVAIHTQNAVSSRFPVSRSKVVVLDTELVLKSVSLETSRQVKLAALGVASLSGVLPAAFRELASRATFGRRQQCVRAGWPLGTCSDCDRKLIQRCDYKDMKK